MTTVSGVAMAASPRSTKNAPEGFRGVVTERDTGVEPVSQPWEGWAQPIYQSRNTGNYSDAIGRAKCRPRVKR